MVQDKVREIEVNKTISNNKMVTEGITKLEQNKNIVVRPADKGGGVVLLKKEDYYGEIQRLLSDTTTYLPLSGDPMIKLKEELSSWVSDGVSKTILTQK